MPTKTKKKGTAGKAKQVEPVYVAVPKGLKSKQVDEDQVGPEVEYNTLSLTEQATVVAIVLKLLDVRVCRDATGAVCVVKSYKEKD